MITNIIVAVTENDAIGKDNKLLFILKEDMKNFKRLTEDNIVVMGRKTYESIGKPLPNRLNIVISREKHENDIDLIWVKSLKDAVCLANKIIERDWEKYSIYEKLLAAHKKQLFIIGGASIYKEALEEGIVDRIYLTRIKKTVNDADAYFPQLDYFKDWEIMKGNGYEENGVRYSIHEIHRKE